METKNKSMSSGCKRLEDNSWRGARAIFFLKFLYILIIVILVLSNIGVEIIDQLPPAPSEDADKESIIQFHHTVRQLYHLLMADLIPMFGTIFVWVVMWVLFNVYWILWLYRAIKNLRCLTKTFFSPVAAVVCSALPGIGYLIGVFILWDIARRQQKLLNERGIQYKPVSKRVLVIFFVFLLLGNIVVIAEVAGTWPGCFAACATTIGIMVSWLHVLRPCVEQGNMLYQLQQKEIIRAKLEDSTLYT